MQREAAVNLVDNRLIPRRERLDTACATSAGMRTTTLPVIATAGERRPLPVVLHALGANGDGSAAALEPLLEHDNNAE